MGCLALPISMLKRRCMGYRALTDHEDGYGGLESPPVRVVVGKGKEKKEFLVDPLVLQQNPFRVLMQTNMMIHKKNFDDEDVVFVDHIDAILFEHMLWLMYNDSSSLFNLNIPEIIDFYAQDY